MAYSGQTVLLQPGGSTATTASVPANVAPPGAVMYTPQGSVMMPPFMASHPPNYEYTPNDFLTLSLITLILCGILSPLTLALSIPGVNLSLQSKKSAAAGNIDEARREGVCAAYLSLVAIIAALVLAGVATGVVIGVLSSKYRRVFYNGY